MKYGRNIPWSAIRLARLSPVSVFGVGSSSSPTFVDLIEASEAGRRIEMLCNKASRAVVVAAV